MARLLLVVTGFWLGLLAASWVMATVNFRTVDHVLGPGARPEMAGRLAALSAEERRVVLRHLVAEINRAMFRAWAVAQIVLGGVALAAAWRMTGLPRILTGAALLLVLVLLVVLTPEMAQRFGALHGAYVGADLVKAILVALAAWNVGHRP
jgi:hypothetical protein